MRRRSWTVVVGGCVQDLMCAPSGGELLRSTSNPGFVRRGAGGVGRNIAEALARLGGGRVEVSLVSAVGDDAAGAGLIRSLQQARVRTNEVIAVPRAETATYLAVFDAAGELDVAVADMGVLSKITPAQAVSAITAAASRRALGLSAAGRSAAGDTEAEAALPARGAVVVDGNLRSDTLGAVAAACAARGLPLWFEPTSVDKAKAGLEVCQVRLLVGATSLRFLSLLVWV